MIPLLKVTYTCTSQTDTNRMLSQAQANLTSAEAILGADNPRVEATRNLIQGVQTIIQGGVHPYTAASLAFRALYNATSLYYLALLENGSLDVGSTVSKLRGRIAELATGMNKTFDTVYSFELSSIAQARLADANLTLEEFLNNSEEPDEIDIATTLGYVSARLETVEHWYQSALEVNETPPYLPSQDRVKYAVSLYLEYTREATEYVLAILHETFGDNSAGDAILERYNRVLGMVETAQQDLAVGRYSRALGLAHRALSDIVAMFVEITSNVATSTEYQDVMEAYLDYQVDVANRFILDIVSSGYPSIIAIDYYEYSLAQKDMGDVDPRIPMEFLSQSISSAIFWKILSASKMAIHANAASGGVEEALAETATRLPERELVILILLTPAWIFLGYLIAVSSLRRRLELEEVQ